MLVPVCSRLLAEAGAHTSLDEYPPSSPAKPGRMATLRTRGRHRVNNSAVGALQSAFVLIAAAVAGLGVALVPRLYIRQSPDKAVWSPWPDSKNGAKNFCLVLPEPLEVE